MRERDFKSLPFTNLKAEASGRVRSGIASVFGNVDAVGDRVMPGAFAKTIAEGAKRCKFLWNHSYQHPPVASIVELKELSRAELPPEVLEKSPEATGGLLVKREYYDTELSNWILQAIDKGDINEMSFAYDTIQSRTLTEPNPDNPEKSREIHELVELKLYDTSDVLWGCNFATVADGAKNLDVMPLGVIASQLAMFAADLKAGRRNATSDQKLIELIHSTSVDLGAICAPDEETGKSGNPADPKKEANHDEQQDPAKAGAAGDSTPLSDLTLRAMKLRANNLSL
jgi:HK97 family phage prohead protease